MHLNAHMHTCAVGGGVANANMRVRFVTAAVFWVLLRTGGFDDDWRARAPHIYECLHVRLFVCVPCICVRVCAAAAATQSNCIGTPKTLFVCFLHNH